MDVKPIAPVARLASTLLAIFVIWIVNGKQALSSIIVFATESHVLAASFAFVDVFLDEDHLRSAKRAETLRERHIDF